MLHSLMFHAVVFPFQKQNHAVQMSSTQVVNNWREYTGWKAFLVLDRCLDERTIWKASLQLILFFACKSWPILNWHPQIQPSNICLYTNWWKRAASTWNSNCRANYIQDQVLSADELTGNNTEWLSSCIWAMVQICIMFHRPGHRRAIFREDCKARFDFSGCGVLLTAWQVHMFGWLFRWLAMLVCHLWVWCFVHGNTITHPFFCKCFVLSLLSIFAIDQWLQESICSSWPC